MIEFRQISKSFGGIAALRDVSLDVRRGECHALIGENGAGKSTLGKILAGIHRPDRGALLLDGATCRFRSPADARRAGIGMVHQELAFCPELSVAENLALGHYPRRGRVFLDRPQMHRRAQQMLARVNAALDVRQPIRALSTAQEQLVQIAAAVGSGATVLVFDEPTSSLSEVEVQTLFALIDDLKQRGVTILYVSHRMPEIFRLADRISVLRDGQHVATLERDAASEPQLVRLMIGRALSEYLPQHLSTPPGAQVLRVARLSSPAGFQEVSLAIHAGEIVGLAGLVGAGRSQVAQAIFGLDPRASGSVHICGKPLRLGSIAAALAAGVGLVPEDRKRQGLVLMLGGRFNTTLAMLRAFASRLGLLRQRAERRAVKVQFERLAVKTATLDAPVAAMSGGNQQKVVLAKWLSRPLKLLILDEPTRGVDIGAKSAIHALIDDLAKQGLAILLISSELPELLALSTRIVVMRAGRVVGEAPRAAATQESILALMAGVQT